MKKLIVTILILGAIGGYWYYAQAATVVVDSYTSPVDTNYNYIIIANGGQTFTASQNATLESASFRVKKSGTPPTATMQAKLYTITGTHGSTAIPNTLLATSDTINVSTLTTSYATTTFTFSGANRIAITSGTQYAVELTYPANGVSNYISIGADTSGTHGGNSFYFISDPYTADATADVIFEVLGSDGVGGSISTVSDLVIFE